MSIIKKIPMPISSLALSIAALGNLLLPHGETIRYICGIISAIVFAIFLAKLLFDFGSVKEELKNPIVLSILPNATMLIMLLCVYIKPYVGNAAQYAWYAAIITHVFIMLAFVKRFVIGLRIETVFPSWFVASTGILAVSITSPVMGAVQVGQAAFYVGFILYFVALPAVIFRMIKINPIPEPARPTIAIFTAPMSLCVTGYLSAFERLNLFPLYVMLIICGISYIYVSINLVFLLRLKFYPTYAALTFPYVISAIAFKEANAFLVDNGYNFLSFAPKISEPIAVIVVVYVFARYVQFLTSAGET